MKATCARATRSILFNIMLIIVRFLSLTTFHITVRPHYCQWSNLHCDLVNALDSLHHHGDVVSRGEQAARPRRADQESVSETKSST